MFLIQPMNGCVVMDIAASPDVMSEIEQENIQ